MNTREIKCLDHGFVRLVDYMGNDSAIVQAARVSYGEGTKTVREDRGLIRYLVRNRHTSPLEMVIFKFHCKMPIFVARQWIRHRTASVNEYSGRYSEMPNEMWCPDEKDLRAQSDWNKQVGEGRLDSPYIAAKIFETNQQYTREEYEKLLKTGLCREQARVVLPLSQYTEWYWQMNLHNLLHFLKLRIDKHAQYEIRVFANAIANLIKDIVPHAWEAFEDYILNGTNFSSEEMNIVREMLHKMSLEDKKVCLYDNQEKMSKTEFKEFKQKIGLENI